MSTRPLALMVDDSDDTRELYALVLRLEGFVVEEARDGQEALHKAGELLPDIIITTSPCRSWTAGKRSAA
jgi:CheY-like chemotaxis protein